MLRLLAGYVQANHHDHLDVLLSSGFDAAATAHPPTALGQAVIKEILNGNSGQFIIRAQAMQNVRMWKARFAVIGTGGTPGPWQDGGLHGDSRRIILNGLTPGTLYSIQVQAVAGSNTYSDWSDAVQHMSM